MLKRLLLLVLCFAMCGCGATFTYRPQVVFIGDSITALWDSDISGLHSLFQQNQWLDVGVIGIGSSQIASMFGPYVIDLQPKAVHIICGTNDVYPGWQLSDTANNIETMVRKARQHHIGVVLGTIPPWGPGALPEEADPSPQRYQRIDQLNQWIMQFGAQQGIQVVDYHALLADSGGNEYVPAYTVDGVHPSAAGFAVMTPAAEQALAAAMQ